MKDYIILNDAGKPYLFKGTSVNTAEPVQGVTKIDLQFCYGKVFLTYEIIHPNKDMEPLRYMTANPVIELYSSKNIEVYNQLKEKIC